MKSFWNTLPRPFFALAPMADVTDVVFRNLFAKYSQHGKSDGGPDVFWTEFVSSDGLMSEGKDHLLKDLVFTENERPIVAQIFGANPDTVRYSASLVQDLGFDGIDINMGCPDRSVEKQGAGAALIQNPKRAREIIQSAKKGAPSLPVSVKTRIGYRKDEIDTWIPTLLDEGIDALTIHARTRKELSLVPARWEHVYRVVSLAESYETTIIGNGDVATLEDGIRLAAETGATGVMVGRGAFGNPWFFNKRKCPVHSCYIGMPTQTFVRKRCECISVEEKLRVLIEHTAQFEQQLGRHKNFAIMKKHYSAYVTGFAGAKELRMALMGCDDASQIEEVIHNAIERLAD